MSRFGMGISCALAAAALAVPVMAETVLINNVYHAQQTAFYCGPASMQMMFDSPQVTGNNAALANFMANNNDQTVQDKFYNDSRGQGVINILGTDPVAFYKTANIEDGAAHNYNGYGFFPGNNILSYLIAGDAASRTVANALKDFQVPATVAVGHGAHWIDVRGVTTIGSIASRNYLITGFYIRDPWTGYAQAHPAAGQPMGLGKNAWYRYGYDFLADGVYRPGAWFNFFNPVNPAPVFGNQFVVEVEPQGPELPDTDQFSSLPSPPAELNSEENASQAASAAVSDLTGADFSSNFSSLTEDTSHDTLITMPNDEAGQGDWIVPYDGPGGANDVRGGLLIDADTGVIDEAQWLDPTDPSMSLSDLDNLFTEEYNQQLPQDNVFVPEPAMLGIALPAMLLMKRRRKAAV